jgi:catechol 2,3-dioxygenase-like lactoylglutathione lyase family enzyme
MTILNIRHTGIVVTDLDASLRFYRDLLGFNEIKRLEESGTYIDNMLGLESAHVTTVKLAAPDGNLIELLKFRSHPRKSAGPLEACSIGITHMALTVSDINQTYQSLSKRGIPFNSPPQTSPDGYAMVAFCRDPDGILVELVEIL